MKERRQSTPTPNLIKSCLPSGGKYVSQYVGSTKEEEVGGVEDRAAWRGGA